MFTNNTDHNITLTGCTVLGRLQLVRSVTPVEVRLRDRGHKRIAGWGLPGIVNQAKPNWSLLVVSDQVVPSKMTDCSSEKLPDFDQSRLTPDQQEQTRQLLREEADTFARNKNDVGTKSIPTCQQWACAEELSVYSSSTATRGLSICRRPS